MTKSKQDPSSSETGQKDKARPGKQGQTGRQVTGNSIPGNDPEKMIQIDDNPDETKRKIPQMDRSRNSL